MRTLSFVYFVLRKTDYKSVSNMEKTIFASVHAFVVERFMYTETLKVTIRNARVASTRALNTITHVNVVFNTITTTAITTTAATTTSSSSYSCLLYTSRCV